MEGFFRISALFLGLSFLFAPVSNADFRFKNLYSDNMLVQAGVEAPIAGYANPNAAVDIEVVFEGGGKKSVSARGGADGRWVAKLPKMKPGVKFSVSAKSGGAVASIKNAVAGQLWLASGQSNMDWHFERGPATDAYKSYLAALGSELDAVKGTIRIFKVRQVASFEALDDVEGSWVEPESARIKTYSAVPLLFEKDLSGALKQPVGVIVASWGGSPIERWVPRSAFQYSENTKAALLRDERDVAGWEQRKELFERERKIWLEKNNTPELRKANRKSEPQFKYNPFDRSTPTPGMLFNSMVSGVYPTVPSGVIWYQGESNERRANEYGDLAKAMVLAWRAHFKAELPFYYVELANFQEKQKKPVEDKYRWGAIREAQGEVLALPKTGVASCADIGDASDLHPPYKDKIARRLANLGLAQVYKIGNPKAAVSPSFKSAKFDGGVVEITLNNADGLRFMPGKSELSGFAVRGDGKKDWHFASGKISGRKILLSCDKVSRIQAVRYGWAHNPDLCLENKYGLPLRPFSTDKGSRLDYLGSDAMKAELSVYPK
ncbi:MAG: hypothetical protein J6P03_04350 [Opitutales bacterium]|nr:hypothetical protein [Opitutales bacterium]